MNEIDSFDGFPEEGLQFLRDIEVNNNKEWFEENRETFDSCLIAPAQDFMAALGSRLQEIEPSIIFDTRTDGRGVLMRFYRDTVAAEQSGEELAAILKMLGQAGAYHLAGEHYKRVPSSYEAEHPREDLLRHAGFYAYPTAIVGRYLTSPQLVDICMAHFSNMAPVYEWLAAYVGNRVGS